METVERDLGLVGIGHKAQAAREFVEPLVQAANRTVDTKGYTLIAGGKMTPEIAYQLWMEKYAFWRLMATLVRSQKQGEMASKRMGPEMGELDGTADGTK